MLRYVLVLAAVGSIAFVTTQATAQRVIVNQTKSPLKSFDVNHGNRKVFFGLEDLRGRTITFDQHVVPANFTTVAFRPDDDTVDKLDVFNGESALSTWELFIENDVDCVG